jgi:hypothetical protein
MMQRLMAGIGFPFWDQAADLLTANLLERLKQISDSPRANHDGLTARKLARPLGLGTVLVIVLVCYLLGAFR